MKRNKHVDLSHRDEYRNVIHSATRTPHPSWVYSKINFRFVLSDIQLQKHKQGPPSPLISTYLPTYLMIDTRSLPYAFHGKGQTRHGRKAHSQANPRLSGFGPDFDTKNSIFLSETFFVCSLTQHY